MWANARLALMLDPEAVLSFWLPERARWFARDADVDAGLDALIGARFGAVHEAVVRGDCDPWLLSPRGRLAFIIVLDQFSRNMFRDRVQSFAWDDHALAIALDGLDNGDDRSVPAEVRTLFYLPLMHAEDLEMQERAVALSQAAGDAQGLRFATAQRALIRRFGRFPHRNQALGRVSTPTELEFLAQGDRA